MSGFSGFVTKCTGGARVDWIVLGAGLALLALMVVHELYRGATLAGAPEPAQTAAASAAAVDAREAEPRGEG